MVNKTLELLKQARKYVDCAEFVDRENGHLEHADRAKQLLEQIDQHLQEVEIKALLAELTQNVPPVNDCTWDTILI